MNASSKKVKTVFGNVTDFPARSSSNCTSPARRDYQKTDQTTPPQSVADTGRLPKGEMTL
ncbi:MAG TPA: hypothetical protein VEZ90_04665 [Blastocatellia bacterium]|nr:hypothetical protein [Blastocatellia bacterium]